MYITDNFSEYNTLPLPELPLNKAQIKLQKKALLNPYSALDTPRADLDEKTAQTIDTLHQDYLSQKAHYKRTEDASRLISRKIGEAKRNGQSVDSFIQEKQLLQRQLSDAKSALKEAEQALLSQLDISGTSQASPKPTATDSNRSEASSSLAPPPVNIAITTLDDDLSDAWDVYVRNQPSASIYHHSKWRGVISRCFQHDSHYLCARDESSHIVGILPLIRLKSRLFGDLMVSMPYFNYGGVVADHPDVASQLIESANALGSSLHIEHIEYRDTQSRDGLPVRTDKVNMILELPDTVEQLWQQLGSKLRAQIKRAQREKPQVACGGIDLVDDFYTVFARNMRDLGTPVYSKRFFLDIMRTFPEQCRVIVVYLEQRPVAVGFLIANKDILDIPWASTIREFNRYSVNMCLYWEVLKYAIEHNFHSFDFGRSTVDAGTYRFKKQWGAKPRQLYWHYWLRDGGEIPVINPHNPRYKLVIAIWQRLPLQLTKWLGPPIVKNIP